MKYSLRALPTVLLIAAAIAIAKAPAHTTVPPADRQAQIHQLHTQIDQLRARQKALDAESVAPFLPRGGGLQAPPPLQP